jgi:hypothetical protein
MRADDLRGSRPAQRAASERVGSIRQDGRSAQPGAPAHQKERMMLALLIFALVALLVAWVITLVLGQIPGVPAFVPTVVWAIAVIVIVVHLAGYA